MKRRRTPPSPRLKRQYNLVHRLRLQGVTVETVGNAIKLATHEEYEALPRLAKKYADALREEFKFVIQTYIPGGYRNDTPPPPIKFRRHKATR